MTIKSLPLKAALAGVVLSSSVSAFAADTAFKVAVIKDTTATEEILAGDLNKSIETLTSKTRVKNTFEHNTSLCVAYLQSDYTEKSESACTAAIESIESASPYSKKHSYLESISYSNRAIARYLNSDFSGAMDDLNLALSINENSVTSGNLKLLKSKLLDDDSSTASLISD